MNLSFQLTKQIKRWNSCLCHFDGRRYQWYDPCHYWLQSWHMPFNVSAMPQKPEVAHKFGGRGLEPPQSPQLVRLWKWKKPFKCARVLSSYTVLKSGLLIFCYLLVTIKVVIGSSQAKVYTIKGINSLRFKMITLTLYVIRSIRFTFQGNWSRLQYIIKGLEKIPPISKANGNPEWIKQMKRLYLQIFYIIALSKDYTNLS